MTQSLLFNDTLELCDPSGAASGGSYWFEALADGASWGDPQPVEVAINSLMRDGAIVSTTGDDNREVTFLIKVRGTDSDSLDAGIQALQRATRKRTTLVWTPPDGYCEPRAWDVETSNLLEPNGFDDLALVQRNEQTFRLRLVCLPHRRSLAKVIDTAAPVPTNPGTAVASFDTTDGWSSWADPTHYSSYVSYAADSTLFVEGTASVKSQMQQWSPGYFGTTTGYHPSWGVSYDKVTGLSIATGDGGYMSVLIRLDHEDTVAAYPTPGLDALWFTAGGVETEVTTFTAVDRSASGFVRYIWPMAAGLTVTGLRFRVNQTKDAEAIPRPFTRYDSLVYAEGATTSSQVVKTLDVQGSARTTGSLHIAAPADTTALGQVLAITVPTDEVPAGFQPDGRRWVVNGTTTPDSTALGGSYLSPEDDYPGGSILITNPVFSVPAGMLTAGPYTIVGLARADSSTLNFGVRAQVTVSGTPTGPISEAEVTPTGLATGWQFVTVGTVYLPPLPVQNADGTVRVRLLFKGADFADVYMIPAWHVGGRPVADFSIVNCGSGAVAPGGASSHLWIDSPSTDQPQGGWWRGPSADRSNAQSAWPDAKKPGVHTFNPGSLTAFVVSTGVGGPTLALEYFPAWL